MNMKKTNYATACLSMLISYAAGGQNNAANISTGNAAASGVVQTHVTLSKTISGITYTQNVKWNTQIEAGDDANTKAGKIRSSAPTGRSEMDDISGTSNTIGAKAKDGWKITAMVFSKDETKEKHTHNMFSLTSLDDHTGAFSLTGDSFATGLDSFGNPGYIDVSVHGEHIRVDTIPGMSGSDVENLVNIELVALNITSSVEGLGSAAMNKFDAFSGGEHDDQMLFIYDLNSLGFSVEVADTGLEFDLSGLHIPAPSASALLGMSGLVVMRRRRSLV